MKFSSERAGQRAGWLDLGDFVLSMNTHLEGRSSVRAIRASAEEVTYAFRFLLEFREYSRGHGAGFESSIQCQVIAVNPLLNHYQCFQYIRRCYSAHLASRAVGMDGRTLPYCLVPTRVLVSCVNTAIARESHLVDFKIRTNHTDDILALLSHDDWEVEESARLRWTKAEAETIGGPVVLPDDISSHVHVVVSQM
jgi:hypothetical protein